MRYKAGHNAEALPYTLQQSVIRGIGAEERALLAAVSELNC